MTTSQHDNDQNEFAHSVPCTTEGISVIWYPGRDTDETERRNGFEKDVVNGEAWGWDREGVSLDDADEEKADKDPPGVRGELSLEVGLREG